MIRGEQVCRGLAPKEVPLSLVCTGGRNFGEDRLEDMITKKPRAQVYAERSLIVDTLDQYNISRISIGDAHGLDFYVRIYARERNIPCRVFRANWNDFGWAAGPMRNGTMLLETMPDLTLAFPGNDGTMDCIKQALAFSFNVKRVKLT